jgi:hypothetical protein
VQQRLQARKSVRVRVRVVAAGAAKPIPEDPTTHNKRQPRYRTTEKKNNNHEYNSEQNNEPANVQRPTCLKRRRQRWRRREEYHHRIAMVKAARKARVR